MGDRLIKTETLTNIADAIRQKSETTEPIAVEDMANAIENISKGAEVQLITNIGGTSNTRLTIGNIEKAPNHIFLFMIGSSTSSSYMVSSYTNGIYFLHFEKDEIGYREVRGSGLTISRTGGQYINSTGKHTASYDKNSKVISLESATSSGGGSFYVTSAYPLRYWALCY